MLRGRATRSADGAFNVAATSPLCILRLGCSLLEAPAYEGGEGASIISGCCYGPKVAATVPRKTKRGSLQKSTRELSAGENAGPRGRTRGVRGREWAWRFVLFPAVWELSRGSLPSARGAQALYPIGRPTAWIAWTVQPMRPQQRDRAAESRAFPPRHGWCGKPVSLQQGSFASSSSQFHSPSPVSLFPSIYPLPAASRTTHTQTNAHEACHNVRGDSLGL